MGVHGGELKAHPPISSATDFCAKKESECSGSLLRDPRDATSHSLRVGGDLRGASPCDSAESPVRKKCTHGRAQLNNRTRTLHHHKRVSLYSPSISRSSCRPSTSTWIRSNTVYSANKEMGSTDDSYSRTGYEPKNYNLMETYVESLTESLTQQQFPWITMTPRSRRCSTTHTENMSITPSEKACLLVSRRRPCPKERRDPLLKEQGDLLWKEVRS